MTVVRVAPVDLLRGTVQVPPDKSLTHRALMLAGVSDRAVRIENPLDSADTAATLGAVEACGAVAEGRLGEAVVVTGRGLRGLRPPPAIDCANAGTLMRLFTGLLVGQRCDRVVLDGDESLRGRPMTRIAKPLRAMGATVATAPGGTPPLAVSGGLPLRGIEHRLEVASAQVKSCVLLAGLFADGTTWVAEPAPSRDHTERMLEAAGVPLLREGGAVGVAGPVASIDLPDVEVPGDFSSAAALLVAGALLGDPEVRLERVNLNPGRTGLLAVMRRMGAEIAEEPAEPVAGEPCGTLVVRRAGALRGTEVAPEEVPAMVDELPLVALLGAMASGTTAVRGAAELRVKESDRITAVVGALRALGADARELEDGFEVTGTGRLAGGAVDSLGDHRLAMLGAVAGLVSEGGVAVGGFDAVAVSYPRFARDLAALGGVPA
ncbi:3-phosphoshikimate 1-carboxyvinyltransferase [Miltoncostaea marina]|uniref:3-phosphoshikimate 1-carboxyvinyltransferase n=1 Tax=Miltoncostaea marina TaxID=2843215 RepID=UPI001C3DBCDC|nr:3-phosphoshikimate 1-carboxyvinyltransferase [Miltoncostaea marina]